eukprot:GHVQ01017721.1.p1 GENE.GHVQ01017721.1~~GHVQ01017721.1.p1  ORF type:complete len:117 (+),score=7.82 GHVQ01017721.1:865-1215(+)
MTEVSLTDYVKIRLLSGRRRCTVSPISVVDSLTCGSGALVWLVKLASSGEHFALKVGSVRFQPEVLLRESSLNVRTYSAGVLRVFVIFRRFPPAAALLHSLGVWRQNAKFLRNSLN